MVSEAQKNLKSSIMKTKRGKDFSLRMVISIQWSQKSNKIRAVESNGFGGKVVALRGKWVASICLLRSTVSPSPSCFVPRKG